MTEPNVVVVGGSLAGVRSAEGLRRGGYDGLITIVSEEQQFPPIDRPQLSKHYLIESDEVVPDRVRMSSGLDVEVLRGVRAVGLDLDAGVVALDNEQQLRYSGLVIATGSAARRLPGADGLCNVHVLRTAADAYALRHALRDASSVAVIGAGVLGCEVASACRRRGLSVSLIDPLAVPMTRVVGPDVGSLIASLHVRSGVRLLLNRSVVGLEGDGRAEGVRLPDQSVDADVVVVAIGASPRTDWLDGSGVKLSDGVVCDEMCFVEGATNVVAAGDVARWRHPLLGEYVRQEHWNNAVAQGFVAGKNLAAVLNGSGRESAFDEVPYFWSDQYDWRIQMVGRLGDYPQIENGSVDEGSFVASFHSHEQLVGALCVNSSASLAQWRRKVSAAMRG